VDRAVNGYARLSPSIRLEFHTYTVLGLKDQVTEMDDCVRGLVQEIRRISPAKLNLAG